MPSYTNQHISRILLDLGAVEEATGGNVFKVRAYKNAAEIVEFMNEPVMSVWERGELEEVKGIGKAIFGKLDELFRTGTSEEIESIKSRVPAGMFPLLPIAGIGAKKAFRLASEFELHNEKTAIADLISRAQAGEIATLEGFGEKSQQEILQSLSNYSPDQEIRLRIDEADALAEEIIDYLKQSHLIIEISALGSLRRRKETIGDIDIGLTTKDTSAMIEHIKAYPKIKDLVAEGSELVRFTHSTGQNVDIKVLDPAMWGSLLQHFSGSKNHNVALRELALKKKLSLSEHGIKHTDKPDEPAKKFASEKEFYAYLGLAWVAPEMREDSGEIELAAKNELPHLIELSDIKGDFHTHTDYEWKTSHDYGADSMETMIASAIDLGYEYIALGDHNPSSSGYAKDELVKEVTKRVSLIRKLKSPIHLLATLEVDIAPDGSLALPDEAMDQLDFAVASVHSSMNQDIDKMTDRVIKAIAHPKVKVVGHPTGRLINKRSGYQLNWDNVFKACVEYNTALEINANPSRLDIHPDVVKEALKAGVKLTINTDAHAKDHLAYMPYGLDVARRGWVEAKDVVNTWNWEKLEKWMG